MKQIKPKPELQKEEFEELRCKSMVIHGSTIKIVKDLQGSELRENQW